MKKSEIVDQVIGCFFYPDYPYSSLKLAVIDIIKSYDKSTLYELCFEIDLVIKEAKTEEQLRKILVDVYCFWHNPQSDYIGLNSYTEFLLYIRKFVWDYLQKGGMERLEALRYCLAVEFDKYFEEYSGKKELAVIRIMWDESDYLFKLCSEIDTLIKETKTEENLKKVLLEIYYLNVTPQTPGIDLSSYTELLLYIKNYIMSYLERGGKNRLCYLFRLLRCYLHLNFENSDTDKQVAVKEFIQSSKVHEIEKLNNEIETLLQKVDNEAQLEKILIDIYFVKVPTQSPRIKLHSYTHLLLYIKNHVWDYLQKGGKDRLDLLYFVFRNEFNSDFIDCNFDKQKALQVTINRSKEDDLFKLTCEIDYLLKQTKSEENLKNILCDVYFVEISPQIKGIELNSYTELLQYIRCEVREHLKTIGYNLLQENKYFSKEHEAAKLY